MNRLTNEQALVLFSLHYDQEMNKIFDRVEFRRSAGVEPTEQETNKVNEELFRLIMYKRNISEILHSQDTHQAIVHIDK